MKTFLHRSWLLVLGLASVTATVGLAAEFKFPHHTFTVPAGFEVELVAGPPLVNRPVEADFDEQGRLYVTDVSGSNDKPDKQLIDKPHRVVRLEDTDGDGRFDKSVVFADKMMFPEGAMWLDGSFYVGAPPSIWKLTDTDGDGVADLREEWFKGGVLGGCANDVHGPYAGPDGLIYWTKGAFAQLNLKAGNGKPITDRAAHIFRCRRDGSGLEYVMSGGMDNPVEVVFTPAGEPIFSSTFMDLSGPGKRDGLAHAAYGGVFPKVNDVTDGVKRTGELLPVMTQFGPAAACGLMRYQSLAFGVEYQENLFACLFNMHKVTRHVLVPEAATFKTRDSDFLVSDNPDFHPTDVIEDADGSLLVIDTGGWYKLCCPTSQLAKPDVLGAIYRIRRVGAPKINDPRGLKLAWQKVKPKELVKRLDDERPAVRQRAIATLAKLGNAAVKPLVEPLTTVASVRARQNAVWALTQIPGDAARAATRQYLYDDREPIVQQTAVKATGLWRDGHDMNQLGRLLASQDAQLARAAAEALGRIGDRAAIAMLFRELARPNLAKDRTLEHSLIFALIEIDDREGTEAGLQSSSSFVHRAALIALDQMDGGGVKPEQVTPLLASTDPLLKQTASWLVGRHSDWGGALAGSFHDRLSATNIAGGDSADLSRQLAQCSRNAAVQDLLAATAGDRSAPKISRLTALRAMAHAGLKEMPPAWARELARVLAEDNNELIAQAVATARALPAPKQGADELSEVLLRVARDQARPTDIRLDALAALPGGMKSVDPALFDFLCSNVDPSKPVLTRSAAASALGKAKLSEEQLLALTDVLRTAGPLEVPRLLAAYENASDEALGLKLVAALKASKGASGLRADNLKPRLAKFPAPVQQQADELLALLNADAAKQKARLEELAATLKAGDVRRGQAVFNSAKAACASCHAIGYLGGKVGPDLTSIGQARTERDLLESIVFPSASFVRSYEPMIVATKSGEEVSGVLRKDASDEVVLATGPDTEVRVARADIAEMRPGTVSVMPAGLDEQLSRQELSDLVAFLKATKWGPQ